MSGVSSSHQDVDIDIGRLFLAVWEQRGKVLLATVAVAALAFAGTSLIKPDYQAETRVLIELRDTTSLSKNDTSGAASQPQLDDLGISSQVQLMKSVDLIKTVARDMKLYDLKEFNSGQGTLSNLLAKFGLAKSNVDLPPEEQVLDAFTKKLEVYQAEKSRVIGIQFTSKDPKLAASIPNKIAEVFLSLQSGAKLDTNSETTKWLEPEIADLRKKVEDAEAKVAAFRGTSDLLQTGQQNSFADQQLNDISAELTKVRSEQATSQARAQGVKAAIASGTSLDSLTEVMASPTIQRLKETETTIMGRISDLSITLMDGHPQLKGLKAQLAGVRAQLKTETQKVLASLQSEAQIGKERERELLAQLQTIKQQAAKADEQNVTLKALEREATSQRDLLESYLARYRQATSRTAGNSSPADARIVSNAVEPTDVFFPKKIPITIVAAVGTLVISSVIIMLMELFTGRALQPVNVQLAARRPEQDEVAAATMSEPLPAAEPVKAPASSARNSAPVPASPDPVFVTAPEKKSFLSRLFSPLTSLAAAGKAAAAEIENRNSMLAAQKPVAPQHTNTPEVPVPQNAIAEAPEVADIEDDSANFSIEVVARYLVNIKATTVVAVSPTGDNGSIATVMLARRIAESGLKTILIDLTRNGCPTRLMAETRNLPGITDLLVGQAAIASSIHADRLSDAHLIPMGNIDPDLAMKSVDRLSMIVGSLSGVYDMVVVECGTAPVADTVRLVRNMSAEIILSVPQQDPYDVQAALADFNAAGCDEVVLLTMPDKQKPRPAGQRAA